MSSTLFFLSQSRCQEKTVLSILGSRNAENILYKEIGHNYMKALTQHWKKKRKEKTSNCAKVASFTLTGL